MALAIVTTLVVISLVAVSPSVDAETRDITLAEDGNLADAISDSSYGSGDTVNITLAPGAEYVLDFTESQGVLTFRGKNLNITSDSSNNAKVKIESGGTLNSVIIEVSQSNYSGSSLSVSNVHFESNIATESANLLHRYFWDVSFDHCNFTNTALTRTLGGNDVTIGGANSITNCNFTGPGDDGANTLGNGLFAVTSNCGSLAFTGNSIVGYDRGLNVIVNQNDDGRYLYVYNNHFENMGVTEYSKPTAFQFGGDVRDMEVIFTTNRIIDSTYGVSVHNSAEFSDSTRLIMSGNLISGSEHAILYSGDGSKDSEMIAPVPVIGMINFANAHQLISLDYVLEDPAQDDSAISITEYGEGSLQWFFEGMDGADPSASGPTFVLSDAEDLVTFSLLVNTGMSSFSGSVIQLGSDIDLTGEHWIPIGNQNAPFEGTFTGKEGNITHKISGLTMDRMDSQGDVYLGLFGYVSGVPNGDFTSTSGVYDSGRYSEGNVSPEKYSAVITDLVLENISINTSGSRVGGLAGYVEDAYISDVDVVSGIISGDTSVGGAVGIGYSVVLKGCTTGESLSIDSDGYNVGGIAGCIRGNTGYPSLITSCENNAEVSATLSIGGLGGIVGHINGSVPVVVYDCHNLGNVTATVDGTISHSYDASVGGIVGFFQGSSGNEQSPNYVIGSTNSGTISTSEGSSMAGNLSGIVGEYYSGNIVDSRNDGAVSGNAIFVGGILGHGAIDKAVVIDGSTNSGELTNTSSTYSGNVSGIAAASTYIESDMDRRAIVYRNMTFDTTEALLDAMPKTGMVSGSLTPSGTSLILENVTVTTPGSLELPERMFGFVTDTQVATQITLNAPPGYTASVARLMVPDGNVSISGEFTMLSISGEGFELTNNGTIDELRIVGGDSVVVRNNASIRMVTDRYYESEGVTELQELSGIANVTVYNGSEEYIDATLNNITSLYLNTEVHNYGTITNSGYLLTAGVQTSAENPIVQSNTFVVHNHGKMIGNHTGTGHIYMFYIPAAKEFTIINYENSLLQNNGTFTEDQYNRWFIYYGTDGVNQSGTQSEDPGILKLVLADNTVKLEDNQYPSDGQFDVDALKAITVGRDDANASFQVENITSDQGMVTFQDGFGESVTVPLVNGHPASAPSFSKAGLTFTGWDNTNYASDSTHIAQWAIADFVPDVSYSDPNPVVGQTVTFTADVTEYPYLEYTYSWTIAGASFEGRAVSQTIGSTTTAVQLTVTAVSAEGNSNISGEVSKSLSEVLDAAEVPTFQIVFDVNVTDYTVSLVSSDNVTYDVVGGSCNLPNGDYTATFTKAGYKEYTLEFSVSNNGETFNIDMEEVTEVDPTPEPEPEPTPDEDDTPVINPPVTDDDDYVPLPPQIVYEDSEGEDDTVTIIACAAAAVVAALMAVFLILAYRRQ